MSDRIEGLNSIIKLATMNSLSGNKSSATSDAFNMVLLSLLKATKEQNKSANNTNGVLTLEDIFSSNKINQNIENLTVDERIENAISKASKQHGVDENLIKSIIKVESNFDPNVVSSAGAKGLMQLMPENCEAFGVTDPFNIEQNIDAGTRHIKEYLDRYDQDVEMALMAYNGGPTRMMKRGVTSINDIYKMPKETQNYVPKVMNYYRGL